MTTPAFQEFETWFFKADTWEMRKEGPNINIINDLTIEEKGVAENLLLNRLDYRDPWIIYGLGALKSKKAEPLLLAAVKKRHDSVIISICWALWMISNDITYLSFLRNFISKCNNEYELIEAIWVLRSFPIENSKEIFVKLLYNDNFLVRVNSFNALGQIFKFTGIFADYQSKLLKKDIYSDDKDKRISVINEILDLIK